MYSVQWNVEKRPFIIQNSTFHCMKYNSISLYSQLCVFYCRKYNQHRHRFNIQLDRITLRSPIVFGFSYAQLIQFIKESLFPITIRNALSTMCKEGYTILRLFRRLPPLPDYAKQTRHIQPVEGEGLAQQIMRDELIVFAKIRGFIRAEQC